MSEETDNKHEMPEQLSDILLVLDKEKMKIQAVKSIDENGKMQAVDPTKKNESQFMRVDKHGDFITNFFSNFWRQLKDPTQFSFFRPRFQFGLSCVLLVPSHIIVNALIASIFLYFEAENGIRNFQ